MRALAQLASMLLGVEGEAEPEGRVLITRQVGVGAGYAARLASSKSDYVLIGDLGYPEWGQAALSSAEVVSLAAQLEIFFG